MDNFWHIARNSLSYFIFELKGQEGKSQIFKVCKNMLWRSRVVSCYICALLYLKFSWSNIRISYN